MLAVEASDYLYRRWLGSNTLKEQRTLKRKRPSQDTSPPIRGLRASASSSSNTRELIGQVLEVTKSISRVVENELVQKVDWLEELLEVSRERQCWMHEALTGLITAHNTAAEQSAKESGLPGSNNLIVISRFLASEAGEDSGSVSGGEEFSDVETIITNEPLD